MVGRACRHCHQRECTGGEDRSALGVGRSGRSAQSPGRPPSLEGVKSGSWDAQPNRAFGMSAGREEERKERGSIAILKWRHGAGKCAIQSQLSTFAAHFAKGSNWSPSEAANVDTIVRPLPINRLDLAPLCTAGCRLVPCVNRGTRRGAASPCAQRSVSRFGTPSETQPG